MSVSSDSGHSSSAVAGERMEEPPRPPPPTQQEREDLERLLGGIEGERVGSVVREPRERETAILDDGDPVAPAPEHPEHTLRLSRSCSCRAGYRSQHCSEPDACDRLHHHLPNGYCMDRPAGSNGHSGGLVGMCQHHGAHTHPHPHPHQSLPPPDLLWDRQQQVPPHYLHRSCSEAPSRHLCPYPGQDPHPLSAPGRLLCRADDYLPYPHHHPASHAHSHPHHGKPPGPYHDVMLLDGLGPPGCPCRDCCARREESAFHAMRLERGESLHWEREGLRRGSGRGDVPLHWERERDAADLQWEREREADYWHRRATVSAYGPQGHDLASFTFDPLPSGHPAYPEPTHSHSHSHLDLKYSGSSGYQTPRQACPYSPYQPSPSESRGYASGYQSESTSPLPPPNNCPAPSSHPEAHPQPYPPDTQPGECPLSSSSVQLSCFGKSLGT